MMSANSVEAAPLETSGDRRPIRADVWAVVLIFASTLPFFAQHLSNLWRFKPHYDVFPVLLAGIVWLAWQRWPAGGLCPASSRLGGVVPYLGLALLAIGVLLFSPWLAVLAFIVMAGGLILSLDGTVRRDWLPVWALLWLLVPPPAGLDDRFIHWLQLATSHASSLVLDQLGVRHLMEGNVLVLPGHRLLVEEACSGINSLFTLLVATSLFVVAARRPLIWSVLLLVASVCWAGLSNIGRVVAIAVAQARYHVDWSTGWQHEALGFAVIGLALLMLVCTDRFLAFLLGPIVWSRVLFRGALSHNPLCKAWNRFVSGQPNGGRPSPRRRVRPAPAAACDRAQRDGGLAGRSSAPRGVRGARPPATGQPDLLCAWPWPAIGRREPAGPARSVQPVGPPGDGCRLDPGQVRHGRA